MSKVNIGAEQRRGNGIAKAPLARLPDPKVALAALVLTGGTAGTIVYFLL